MTACAPNEGRTLWVGSLTRWLRPSLKASISCERVVGNPWGRRPLELADQEVYPT